MVLQTGMCWSSDVVQLPNSLDTAFLLSRNRLAELATVAMLALLCQSSGGFLTLDSLIFFFTLPRCRRLLGRRVVKIPHVDTSTPVLEYSKLPLLTNVGLYLLLPRPIGPSATICQCKAFGTSTAGQHGACLLYTSPSPRDS